MPLSFPLPGESAVASYPYTDVAEGTGVVVYYGAHKRIDSTDSYFLTTNVVASDEIAKDSGTHSNASATKLIDLDFDVVFNKPKIVNGRCYFSVPFAVNNQSTTGSGYVIAKVRKWDGSTETEIANAQSRTIESDGTPVTNARTLLFSVDVTNAEFSAGQTLRITLEGWGVSASGAGWHHINIGHDPANRTGWTESSASAYTIFDGTSTHGVYSTTPQLKFYIPFKLSV